METLIIHADEEKMQVIQDFLISIQVKFEIEDTSESPYDLAFVAKIQRSSQQLKEGKGRIIRIEDLWK